VGVKPSLRCSKPRTDLPGRELNNAVVVLDAEAVEDIREIEKAMGDDHDDDGNDDDTMDDGTIGNVDVDVDDL
jgi:hypothetical protein